MSPIFISVAFLLCPLRVEQRIMDLQPDADRAFARELAYEMCYWSLQYRTDPMISVAIAMQESSLRPGAVSSTGDSTVFQFSPHTITAYHLDRARLKVDLGYQVFCHFRLLQEKRQTCPGPLGWSCYHSTTPRLRRQYEKNVLRYYKH